MIKNVEIENYRSFEKFNLSLDRLNVIIGPNGSGKSNFLEIFNLFVRASERKLSEAFIKLGGYQQIVHMMDVNRRISFKFDIDQLENYPITYQTQFLESKGLSVPLIWIEDLSRKRENAPDLHLVRRDKNSTYFHNRNGHNDYFSQSLDEHSSIKESELERVEIESTELVISQIRSSIDYPTPDKLVQLLGNWIVYKPMDVSADSPLRNPHLIGAEKILAKNGENLIPVLYNIQSNDDVWEEILGDIKAFYPGFSKITFPFEGGAGKLGLQWWEFIKDETLKYTANQLSDGTIRLLTLEAILSNPTPPPLICIDEPELSMHPEWIRLIADLLKRAANSGKTQVIVTTHSPELISQLDTNNIIVFQKTNGKTEPKRLNKDKLLTWLIDYKLGEIWTKGLLEGDGAPWEAD